MRTEFAARFHRPARKRREQILLPKAQNPRKQIGDVASPLRRHGQRRRLRHSKQNRAVAGPQSPGSPPGLYRLQPSSAKNAAASRNSSRRRPQNLWKRPRRRGDPLCRCPSPSTCLASHFQPQGPCGRVSSVHRMNHLPLTAQQYRKVRKQTEEGWHRHRRRPPRSSNLRVPAPRKDRVSSLREESIRRAPAANSAAD